MNDFNKFMSENKSMLIIFGIAYFILAIMFLWYWLKVMRPVSKEMKKHESDDFKNDHRL